VLERIRQRTPVTGHPAGDEVARGLTDQRLRPPRPHLLDLPIERDPHRVLVPRIWQLRESFSAYDAAYIALAEAIVDGGAPLLTADARLARAADAHADMRVILAE
jgi:predicted nucleic acid-binding protein